MYPEIGGEDFFIHSPPPETVMVDRTSPAVGKKNPTPIPTGERTVGVEIEGVWSPESAYKLLQDEICSRKRDGSLRGRDSFEVVSPVLKSSTYQGWLRRIPLEGLDSNTRCGIHCWFGTKDKSWRAINKLLYLCALRERDFVDIVSPTRIPVTHRDLAGRPMSIGWHPLLYRTKQGFVRSVYGTTDLMHDIGMSKMQNSKRANDRVGHEYPGPINRTWWLNIHGHFTGRKAVEVRLLHTTNVPEIIEAWTELWIHIINNIDDMTSDYIAEAPLEEIAPKRCKVLFEAKKHNKEVKLNAYNYSQHSSAYVVDKVLAFAKEKGLLCAE